MDGRMEKGRYSTSPRGVPNLRPDWPNSQADSRLPHVGRVLVPGS
jgi:hypothetical protein